MAVPRLSVLVLNYNYGRYLAGCLESILQQTFEDFELILIDDCSTDDSVEVARSFERDPRFRLVRHPMNSGFAVSLIEGTSQLSSGEFRTVISADDIVRHRRAFETQVGLLSENPDSAFCFSAVDCFGDNGEEVQVHHSFSGDTVLTSAPALQALLTVSGVWPVHSGTMLRARAHDAVGGYRTDLRMALDLGMWVALAAKGGFAYSGDTLYGYRVHTGQMSSVPAKIQANTNEVVRILRAACREGSRLGLGSERRLFKRAIGNHLGAAAAADAFGGNQRAALLRCVAALRECPFETLSSTKLWGVAARAALGEHGFMRLRKAVRLLGDEREDTRVP